MECPCRYCKKRKVSCHATCKDYKGWRKEYQKVLDQEKKAMGESWGGYYDLNSMRKW